jgi:hypothetical protein
VSGGVEGALLPCPFCGSAASIETEKRCHAIMCLNPDCGEVMTRWLMSTDEAIAAWNTRAALSQTPPTPSLSTDVQSAATGFHEHDVSLKVAMPAPGEVEATVAETVIVALPAAGEVEEMGQTLEVHAETRRLCGQFGVADELDAAAKMLRSLATVAASSMEVEPFGYWVEQRLAEPILLRKPSYIPEPSELRTVTPLYASPTLATVAAGDDEGVALDWRAVAKLAGEHGVRYRTNTALEQFLAAIRLLSQGEVV